MQSKSTFPARIAPFSVLEPLPFSRLGLRKARFERETYTVQKTGYTLSDILRIFRVYASRIPLAE